MNNERDAHQIGRPTLHPALDDLLGRLREAERTATGEQRRPTFRLMRDVLGAAMAAGVPAGLLAECLGTTAGSVRNRAQHRDSVLGPGHVLELTGLTPAELDERSGGRLVGTPRTGYATSAVVRALLETPPGAR